MREPGGHSHNLFGPKLPQEVHLCALLRPTISRRGSKIRSRNTSMLLMVLRFRHLGNARPYVVDNVGSSSALSFGELVPPIVSCSYCKVHVTCCTYDGPGLGLRSRLPLGLDSGPGSGLGSGSGSGWICQFGALHAAETGKKSWK